MWLNTLENILLRSNSSSPSLSTSTMIIIMVVIVISTTSATSWASVREQRRKRSVYENGKQLFTQSVSLVLKSTNQWQFLQIIHGSVYLRRSSRKIRRQKNRIWYWEEKSWLSGLPESTRAPPPEPTYMRKQLDARFLQWKFVKLIFFWMSKQQKSVTNMFLMTVPWTFHSNRLQQHQLENHYPATTPNPLNKICKCILLCVDVFRQFLQLIFWW